MVNDRDDSCDNVVINNDWPVGDGGSDSSSEEGSVENGTVG